MDEDGHRSGYSYEVLQRIAQHENVQFEYLAYDCDANEAADMLERGETDLLPTLRKTDERAERFDFSNEPISNVATMLTVKAGNRSIVAGNYDTFDGMVVGMSRSGNGRNESFKAYAEKNGFTYTPVYFDTDEELSAALRSGTITAAVSNRMRQTSNEWVIDTFDNEDVYIAVRKGDASTLRLVNDALIRMDRDDPTWRTTLFDKYNKNIHTSNKLYLTAAEENYITAHNAADKEFTVLANPDRYPYSYLDKDGKLTGIMVDLFKLVAGRARLHYKFLTPADRTEYKQILSDRAADFVIDLTSDFSTAEDCGYKLTDSYLSAEFSWVLLRSHDGDLRRWPWPTTSTPARWSCPAWTTAPPSSTWTPSMTAWRRCTAAKLTPTTRTPTRPSGPSLTTKRTSCGRCSATSGAVFASVSTAITTCCCAVC